MSDLIVEEELRAEIKRLQRAFELADGLRKDHQAEIERITDELISVEQIAKDRYCKMQSEIERLLKAFAHYHVGPGDECRQCGLDLRNPVHIRTKRADSD